MAEFEVTFGELSHTFVLEDADPPGSTVLHRSDVDSALSSLSENPVQNKVIYEAMQLTATGNGTVTLSLGGAT